MHANVTNVRDNGIIIIFIQLMQLLYHFNPYIMRLKAKTRQMYHYRPTTKTHSCLLPNLLILLILLLVYYIMLYRIDLRHAIIISFKHKDNDN